MNLKFWKRSPARERKSVSNFINLFEFLSQTGWGQVTAWQSLRYYEQIAPVAIGVDKVTDEFKALQPSVFDRKEQQYITDHPIVKFLEFPNASISMQDFQKNYATYYEVTGEVYLMATGNPNREPLEIFIIPPQFVSIEMGGDGFPASYKVSGSSKTGAVTFERKEVNGRMRYYNEGDREIWHVKNFNASASSTNFHGASRLNSIFYEIEQHLYGSRHNLSLLQRGGRLSGAVKTEGVLDDEQFKRLKEEIQNNISGADNAGYIPLFEGGADFVEMGKSNKDMDFANLMQSKTEAIFNRLSIPLPLISAKSMTLNNFATAQVALYDNAVLPLASKLYKELTLFLGPRFGMTEDQVLSVDTATVPALQSRRMNTLLMQSKLGILTDNEQRAMVGREGYSGGDVIYKPATLVPVGQDQDTTGNRDKPTTRKKFFEILREQKDMDGNRRWTDEQIDHFANREGLE